MFHTHRTRYLIHLLVPQINPLFSPFCLKIKNKKDLYFYVPILSKQIPLSFQTPTDILASKRQSGCRTSQTSAGDPQNPLSSSLHAPLLFWFSALSAKNVLPFFYYITRFIKKGRKTTPTTSHSHSCVIRGKK